jgi:hypothetical protein
MLDPDSDSQNQDFGDKSADNYIIKDINSQNSMNQLITLNSYTILLALYDNDI